MSLVHLFKDEIEMIKSDSLREFVVDGLDQIPDFYGNMTLPTPRGEMPYPEYIQRTVNYARELVYVLNADTQILDLFTVAALLHSFGRWEKEHESVHLAYVRVRVQLYGLQQIVGFEDFDAIMRVIESQEGFQCIYPQFQPQVEDPAHMWVLPFAVHLAKQ